MRVLVVGGLGYLGSIIVDMISKSGDHEVEILDCAMWGNEDVKAEIQFTKFHPFQTSVNGKFDCVVLSCLPDNPDFYSIYRNYAERYKTLLEDCCKITNKVILCSSYQLNYDVTENTDLCEFFTALENMVSVFNGTIIRVPSLHGPSPRMRWDTTANSVFLMEYLNRECLIESDWLTAIPFAGVVDMAQFITNHVVNNKKGGSTIQYFTEKLCLLNLAHIIKCQICEDVPQIDDIVINTAGAEVTGNLRFFNEPMTCSQNIRKSIAEILINLKNNALPEFLTDKYNNGNIIALAPTYRNFLNEVGEE